MTNSIHEEKPKKQETSIPLMDAIILWGKIIVKLPILILWGWWPVILCVIIGTHPEYIYIISGAKIPVQIIIETQKSNAIPEELAGHFYFLHIKNISKSPDISIRVEVTHLDGTNTKLKLPQTHKYGYGTLEDSYPLRLEETLTIGAEFNGDAGRTSWVPQRGDVVKIYNENWKLAEYKL